MSKARELASLGNAYSDGALSNRNRIINGAMVIDQRNGGGSVTPSSLYSTYTLDRWNTVYSVGSKFSIQQNAGSVTPPTGFATYLGATSLSAYTVTTETFSILQGIEGYNIADLNFGTANAKTITLSFWVRSSLTGTFGGAFQNSGTTRTCPFSYTINSANTWEYKTFTVSGDTSGTWLTTNGNGLTVVFSLGAGSGNLGTSGEWSSNSYYGATGQTSVVSTSGATFYLTGVQLEVGDTATPFEHRSYGQELALCQRYYRHYQSDSSTYMPFFQGGTVNSTLFRATFPLSPPMRRQPSLLTTGVASNYQISGTTNANCTSVPYLDAQSEPDVLDIAAPHGAVTGGQAFFLRAASSTTAFIGLDAEL